MIMDEVTEKLAAKLKGGLLSAWEAQAVHEFAVQVATDNAKKAQAALDSGMTADQVVEQVLYSKARSALRGQTMEKYGQLIRDTHPDGYMSWKSPKEGGE